MKHHVYRAGMIVAVLSLTAAADELVRPTGKQADALRRLRGRVADMPVPGHRPEDPRYLGPGSDVGVSAGQGTMKW